MLSNSQVRLVFWGVGWSANPTLQAQMQSAVDSLLVFVQGALAGVLVCVFVSNWWVTPYTPTVLYVFLFLVAVVLLAAVRRPAPRPRADGGGPPDGDAGQPANAKSRAA
jgi:hypothetical protein